MAALAAPSDAGPAAIAPRADLVGVCAHGDGPCVVVDFTVALPHNPAVAGDPVPAGTAAKREVAAKRDKCGKTHILTPGFFVAALERFGYFHPETIRLAKTLGHLAARR